MYKLLLALVILLLGTACSGGGVPEATPIPTPEVWRVHYSSEMRILLPILHQCINDQPNIGLSVNEYILPFEDQDSADFIFHWGEIDPKGYSAYVLGVDEIRIVVNKMNPIDTLSLSQVEAIFTGKITSWNQLQVDDIGKVQAWIFAQGTPIQDIFFDQFPGVTASELDAMVAPDIRVLREQIIESSGGIGFLPGIWQHDELKTLEVIPATALERVDIPIVLLIKQKMNEKQTIWVKCIQESWQNFSNN